MNLSTNARSLGRLCVALAALGLALAPTQTRAQCAIEERNITVELEFRAASDERPPTYFWLITYDPDRGNANRPYVSNVYFQKASDGSLFEGEGAEAGVAPRPVEGEVTNWEVLDDATIPGSSVPAIRFAWRSGTRLADGRTFQFRYTTEPQEPIRVYARTANNKVFDAVFTEANCATLPVELAAFDATLDGEEALLRWTTAGETNNAGFRVQHAAPGAGAFQNLGFVEGQGTTAQAHDYAFRTGRLSPGTHRFRLKQVDADGAVHFSPALEVAVALPERAHLSPAYPNPFNPETRFTLEVKETQAVRVEVFDALGRRVALLHEGVLEAGAARPFQFEAASLPSGMYLVRAQGEAFTQTRRVTLLK